MIKYTFSRLVTKQFSSSLSFFIFFLSSFFILYQVRKKSRERERNLDWRMECEKDTNYYFTWLTDSKSVLNTELRTLISIRTKFRSGFFFLFFFHSFHRYNRPIFHSSNLRSLSFDCYSWNALDFYHSLSLSLSLFLPFSLSLSITLLLFLPSFLFLIFLVSLSLNPILLNFVSIWSKWDELDPTSTPFHIEWMQQVEVSEREERERKKRIEKERNRKEEKEREGWRKWEGAKNKERRGM